MSLGLVLHIEIVIQSNVINSTILMYLLIETFLTHSLFDIHIQEWYDYTYAFILVESVHLYQLT